MGSIQSICWFWKSQSRIKIYSKVQLSTRTLVIFLIDMALLKWILKSWVSIGFYVLILSLKGWWSAARREMKIQPSVETYSKVWLSTSTRVIFFYLWGTSKRESSSIVKSQEVPIDTTALALGVQSQQTKISKKAKIFINSVRTVIYSLLLVIEHCPINQVTGKNPDWLVFFYFPFLLPFI